MIASDKFKTLEVDMAIWICGLGLPSLVNTQLADLAATACFLSAV